MHSLFLSSAYAELVKEVLAGFTLDNFQASPVLQTNFDPDGFYFKRRMPLGEISIPFAVVKNCGPYPDFPPQGITGDSCNTIVQLT